MESIRTNDSKIRQQVNHEIDSRKLSWFKKKFLTIICEISLFTLLFNELQYDDFMYSDKDIKRGFLTNIPFFLMLTCMLSIFLVRMLS